MDAAAFEALAKGHLTDVRGLILQLDARVKQAYADGVLIQFAPHDPIIEYAVKGVNAIFAEDQIKNLKMTASLLVRTEIDMVEPEPEPEPEPELPFDEPEPEVAPEPEPEPEQAPASWGGL